MKCFKKITKENLETRFPNNSAFTLESMEEETLHDYLNLYSYTQTLLNSFVSETLGISRYDAYLSYSPLHYQTVLESEMDIYQYLSMSVLKYFYVRNNLYLERLTSEERSFLINKMLREDLSIDEKTKDFLLSVFPRLIVETNKVSGEIGITNFGPEVPNFMAPMNSLVIGLRYDEFYEGNLSDDEWDSNHEKQRVEVAKMMAQLNEELSSKISIPIKVIQYNEFSIKKNSFPGVSRV